MARVLLLTLWLALVAWAAEPELVHMTSTGGLTPWGVGHFEMKVGADGRLSWYSLRDECWRETKVSAEDLASLTRAIEDTDFAALKPDDAAMRPSAYDGQDVTLVLSTKAGPRTLELWKLAKAKVPVAGVVYGLLDKYVKQ
jgi:hypothetical protein